MSFGNPTTTTAGFSFGAKPPATTAGTTAGFSFGAANPASGSSFSFSGAKPPAAAPAANTTGGFGFGAQPPAASTAAASSSGMLSFAKPPATATAAGFSFAPSAATSTTQAPNVTLTTSNTGTGFGLLGAQVTKPGVQLGTSASAGTVPKAATTVSVQPAQAASGLGASSAPSLSLSTSTAAKPSVGLPAAASATSTAVSTTATTSSSGATAATAATGPKMSYKQLEDQMNKWWMELDHQEKVFLEQATKVNAWDKVLVENGQKITDLNSDVEKIKLDQHRLTHELDFILAQQKELEEMLVPLEDSVAKLPPINYQQHTDSEREHTYQIAENIDAQLKRMTEDLKEVIDHLNTGAGSQESTDPMIQISKILNAHMESLQWVDQNAGILQRKTEEVARYADTTKKEHERNFRLAYS